MAIKINDIPPEGLTLQLADKLDLLEQGTALTAYSASVSLKPVGSGTIHISGKVQAEPQLECSRCLVRFPFRIESDFSLDASPVATIDKAPEHELTGGELETEFYEGDAIDPVDIIKEQLLISLPMVPLHSPDCKGLCQSCGADLNKGECRCGDKGREDFSPFSKLKDLFKK